MNGTDFRPQLNQAQQWVGDLLDNVSTDQLDLPTPCTEFTVGQLIEHLLGVEERLARMGTEATVGDAAFSSPLPETDLAGDFRRRAADGSAAWAERPASELWSEQVTAPFGRVPGGVALLIYTSEHLTHGWDLAVATGQDSEADPGLVAPVLAGMRQALPAENRGGDIPFDPPVSSSPDAGPTEQLANWLGRSR